MGKSLFYDGKDALGRAIRLASRPERVVSLVPSQTELLADLGIGRRLVGRTRYCIHPREALSAVTDVGGTKRVDFEKLAALKPDLILAEKEENPREMVESLSSIAPVFVTDVVSIPSAIEMCRSVGRLMGQMTEAEELARAIEIALQTVRGIAPPERVLYLIWRKPWMGAGAGTFIQGCLEHLGFQNACTPARYPELTAQELRDLAPNRVFLSSEPFPFSEAHAEEIREVLPNARIDFVDGELFSWYGSRMLKMPEYWLNLRAKWRSPGDAGTPLR